MAVQLHHDEVGNHCPFLGDAGKVRAVEKADLLMGDREELLGLVRRKRLGVLKRFAADVLCEAREARHDEMMSMCRGDACKPAHDDPAHCLSLLLVVPGRKDGNVDVGKEEAGRFRIGKLIKKGFEFGRIPNFTQLDVPEIEPDLGRAVLRIDGEPVGAADAPADAGFFQDADEGLHERTLVVCGRQRRAGNGKSEHAMDP